MAKFRRYAKKAGIGSMKSLIQIDAMLYGAIREKASTAIAPYTSWIPGGSIADEVGMGLLNWAVAKWTGKGMLRQIALKGLVVENARVGEAVAQGQLGLLGGSSTSSGVFNLG